MTNPIAFCKVNVVVNLMLIPAYGQCPHLGGSLSCSKVLASTKVSLELRITFLATRLPNARGFIVNLWDAGAVGPLYL